VSFFSKGGAYNFTLELKQVGSARYSTFFDMEIIYFMIACSMMVALGFLAAFIWAMRSGQHDDLYTPSIKILLENPPSAPKSKENRKV
jgi:cbb3-type cytochrome oxidase maturation protein